MFFVTGGGEAGKPARKLTLKSRKAKGEVRTRFTTCVILIELRPHFVPGLPHVIRPACCRGLLRAAH